MSRARWVGRQGRNGCDEGTIAVAHARNDIDRRTCRIGCAFLCFACRFERVVHAVGGAGAVVRRMHF